MKKYFIFLVFLILIDVFVCLSVNADLLSIEKDYGFYHQTLVELRQRNDQLTRETTHLSSLTRINQLAEEMELTLDKKRIVFISQDQFAMR